MDKQRVLKLAGILTEAKYKTKYYVGNKIPKVVAEDLAVIPLPPDFDFELWYDVDNVDGYGGVNSIVIEDPPFLITSTRMVESYYEFLESFMERYGNRD